MNPVATVNDTIQNVTKVLTLKNIITLAIVFIVVSLLISFVIRNEVTLKDSNGNVIAKGETRPRLKFGLNKQ